jgi:prepilin-type N-terminal cleavage/methylation domain-containing protein
MKNGFTLIELLVSMAVGIIALGAIIFMMDQFVILGPKALDKVNEAQEAIVINQRIQAQLIKMGPSISSINVDPKGKWISYQVQVPFGLNGIYYTPYTQIATMTMQGSSIILKCANQNTPSQIQTITIAQGVSSLTFLPATSGSVAYTFTLSKGKISSSYTSAITSINLR